MIGARWLARAFKAGPTSVLALALTMAVATPAFAQPSQADLRTARELFAKAEKDQDAQQWGPALEKFQRVAAIKMTAGVRFRIALCEENLGRLLDALNDYTAALEKARADNNKDVVDAATEALTQLRPRVPLLRVVIPTGVADAEVLVDKKAIASSETGYATNLEPGTHSLEVHAPGRQPYAKSLKVVEREITTVEPPLLPVTQPLATPPPPTVTVIAPPPPPVEPTKPPPSAPSHGRNLTLPIVTTAGAVALVGLGFGAYFLAGSKADDARAACDKGDCTSSRSEIRTFDALAITGWATGAALGGLAIYLWTRPAPASASASLRERSPARHVDVGWRLVPWGQGMRLEGSF